MKKIHLLLFISICFQSVFAQNDGLWDKDRAITKEIKVSARDRIILKTDDLPTGTTEIIYRITLLDDNQQLAGSLVSVLKAIPDPTGISQGSAGAVFLMSKISGEDKCKYAIFTSNTSAQEYKKTGKMSEACLSQETPLSKDARRLSIDKSLCVKNSTGNLWFGFESTNWFMKQKIVLEIVPWIDTKLSRGWTVENRKEIINQCKTSALARKMANSDDFCICIEEKIQQKFRFEEFQKLLAMEQSKAYKDFGTACYGESNVSTAVFTDLRNKGAREIEKGNYGNAITHYLYIVNEGKATAVDYANLGFSYLITKQYAKALKFLKEGEQKDPTELLVKINLAHTYLLNGNYSDAKSMYKKYQSQNVMESLSWSDKVKNDFILFQKAGIKSDDFEKIIKLFR